MYSAAIVLTKYTIHGYIAAALLWQNTNATTGTTAPYHT